MPLVKFYVIKGRSKEAIDQILDAAHGAIVRSFGVVESDRYQLVIELDADQMRIRDTGLGIARTDAFMLVEIVSSPRSRPQKLAFYKDLCASLEKASGIAASDVMIDFIQNDVDDWSFGMGRAQYVTSEL